ncbi:MAG TPA: T9SS type A sorting domain-containing protein, partial [Saprospiraceae bacterium]|nr:T9SS type A sorting domain-containing protein [Saprospiraceae bacterium]
PVVTDNCPGFELTHIDIAENLPCNPLTSISGTVNRIWTVTDSSGNTATCQQTIVRQRSFTGIQFPPGDTASCTEHDNFNLTGTPSLQVGDYRFSLWPTSYCEFEIQFADTLQTAFCDGGGRYVRTWKVFDLCQPLSPANPLTGQQVIDFVDETGPVLTCDSSVTVVADATDCLIELDLPDVVFFDNCSQIASVLAHWPAGDHQDTVAGVIPSSDTLGIFGTLSDFPAGNTTVTYVVQDDCGNTGTCQTLITVWDTDPPIADCISFFTVTLDADGEFALGADTLDQNSKDSCSQILSFKMRRAIASNTCISSAEFDDAVPFCCSDIGDTIELTRRVYDVAVPDGPVSSDYAQGQFSDCIVKVIVLDTLPLGCIAPPDLELGCKEFDLQTSDFGTPVYNCLVDSSVTSVDLILYDSSCSTGLVTRRFRVFDKNGNTAECFQQITVNHVQDYYIKFPDDVILTVCDGSNNYGEPEFSENGCEDLVVTFEDEIFNIVSDACFKIERTWTIRNRCTYDSTIAPIAVPNPTPNSIPNHPDNLPGPVVSPSGTPAPWAPTSVKIGFLDTAPSSYADFWDANANAYTYKQTIKIIDTQKPVIDNCPVAPVTFGDSTNNDPLLWHQNYWWDPATSQHDLCEGNAPLSITAGDACSGKNIVVSYLLFLNLDDDNTQETVINSNNPPAPGTVNFNNFSTPNYAGGTPRVFDGRPVMPNEVYRWAIHQSVNGNQITASVQWKTFAQMPTANNPFGLPGIAPQLPHGTHKIRWTVTDGCGNDTTCEYSFTVKDAKPPTVACLNNLSVEMPVSGSIDLSSADFLQYNEDNCTPSQQLVRSVRKAGTGSGFPVDANGNPQDTITFSCTDLGAQTVELWARDAAGNAGFCTATITLTDIDSSCNLNFLSVAGNVFVSNTALTLSATHPSAQPVSLTDLSDAAGDFEFAKAIPSGSNYMLTPQNDENPLNGVSTFDLVLISKHILGLELLDTPYKIISADANRNNSVTTFDIVEIRKLILGIYTDFPDNTSWRFVDADYVFPDPANPFLVVFPEKITRTNVQSDQLEDNFIAMKTGDVNGSAMPTNLNTTEEREQQTLLFDVKNRSVEAGEQFTVAFKAVEQVLGYQFTLNINGLEVVDILPGEGMTPGNFGIFEDAVTAAVENGAGEFAVTFRALRPGQLSGMLSVSSRITRAEAYREIKSNYSDYGNYSNYSNYSNYLNESNDRLNVALRFDNGVVSAPGFELYQNRPNPFHDKTLIGFDLPEPSDATLTVFDDTGRVLFTQSGSYPKGYHAVSLEQVLAGNAGVLYYKLETPTNSAVRKMVLVK